MTVQNHLEFSPEAAGSLGEGSATTAKNKNTRSSPRRLRMLPAYTLAALLVFVRWVLPIFSAEAIAVSVLGSLALSLAIFIWWLFFSKAPIWERVGVLALVAVGFIGAKFLIHTTIANAMMGMMYPLFAMPSFALALVAWAGLSQNLAKSGRMVTLFATVLLVAGVWSLLRTDGMSGEAQHDLTFRFAETVEQKLVAKKAGSKSQGVIFPQNMTRKGTWTGFRGSDRDGTIHNLRLNTDWESSPPELLWQLPIGPGASSFAVLGDYFYTQEQRGEEEWVSAYAVESGSLIWKHSNEVRFADSHTGPGPRATPALHGNRLYTFGATGVLNALDAHNGDVLWSRTVAVDHGQEPPSFGFSSSPLVYEDLVMVALTGQLIAYDRLTGEQRWVGPDHGGGYSSPKLFNFAGEDQVLLASGAGVTGFAPVSGTVLWHHEWIPKARSTMPTPTGDGDILLSGGERTKLRRLAIVKEADQWTAQERWTSNRLRPYYSDIVTHKGYAYGFDGSILSCIDLSEGERQWKGGRYGAGQVLLLADQDLLLVLTEKGELKLVNAKPDAFEEVASMPALTGKTWNHPVLVDDLLLVRNVEEMMAFKLPLEAR